MASTGVYWLPVYAVLEGSVELVVGNAQHIKNVPGRRTDVRDCAWIARLLRHGLIRSSLVPPKPLRDLRDLLRYRRTLVNAEADERHRLLKLLETANIKLSGVATDVFGVSGRAMLRALIAGETDPAAIAHLARGKLRNKLEALALDGCVGGGEDRASARERGLVDPAACRARQELHPQIAVRLARCGEGAWDQDGAPFVTRVERRLPALWSSRGTRPAQDKRCPAVGKRLMAVPIAARITWAARAPMPGIVVSRKAAPRKGASAASIRASQTTTVAASGSIVLRC